MAADSTMDQTEGAAPEDPLAGVPELRSYVTNDEGDKVAALRLVAESVVQMRERANTALILNPLNLAILVAILSVLARYMVDHGHSVRVAGTTCGGLLTVLFALCRYGTQAYITTAREIDWDWLGSADVIVTRFGDDIIGAAIVEWMSGETRQRRKKAWRVEIRAWTVHSRYRRKGVGSALLEDAVKESRKKGADTIEFAEDHASKSSTVSCCAALPDLCRSDSMRILPSFYNSRFDRRERRARELLKDLLEASPSKARRKRGGSA